MGLVAGSLAVALTMSTQKFEENRAEAAAQTTTAEDY